MIRRLQPFSMGSSSKILAKGLLPYMAETFRTHSWSLMLKYTVPFSSMGNADALSESSEETDDEDIGGGRPLKVKPISISNKNLHILPFFKDQNISSKRLLPSMAETFRTHDWSLLLKYGAPFSSMRNTPEFVDDDGGSVKLISMSDKDLRLPSFVTEEWHISSELQLWLPSMAETFKTKDWSLLQKFSSMDSNLDIEDALDSELAAICVWFLFTKVAPHVKEGAARTLTFISLGTSNARKMSTDQAGVENLVECILRSGNAEAQRQVCLALLFLAFCPSGRLGVTFGDGIQDQLLQLVCNLRCNLELTYPVISAVASVSKSTKGMREKIVKTELLDSWLVKLVSREDDESIMENAYRTVACIACERCDSELWDHLKEKILPSILKGVCDKRWGVFMLSAAINAILQITEYGSSDQIDDLAENGALEFLVYAYSCEDYEEEIYDCNVRESLIAMANILKAGVVESHDHHHDDMDLDMEEIKKGKNKYAKMMWNIDDAWYDLWKLTDNRFYNRRIACQAVALSWQYGPDTRPWVWGKEDSECEVFV